MLKRILSIDLDILLSPYCGIYNDMVHPDDDRYYNWDKISSEFSLSKFSLDANYKNIVCKLIDKYSAGVDKVYTAYDHAMILDAINREFKSGDTFEVHNIDYHHDIFYGEEQEKRLEMQNLCCCGSWVGFMAIKKVISKYFWYCGKGSSFPKGFFGKGPCSPIDIIATELSGDRIPDGVFDMLFISISPPWIPPYLDKEIQDILKMIPQDKGLYLNGRYQPNGDVEEFLKK